MARQSPVVRPAWHPSRSSWRHPPAQRSTRPTGPSWCATWRQHGPGQAARQAGCEVAQLELMTSDLVLLVRAADYAARQHIAQRRKGETAEPYINHLTEVAALLAEATSGEDVILLAGGLLHDTLEDTGTTYEDLVQRFGPEVAALVAEVTDDKLLRKEERKRLQIEKTPGKSRRAKLPKLTAQTSNLRSLVQRPPKGSTAHG